MWVDPAETASRCPMNQAVCCRAAKRELVMLRDLGIGYCDGYV